MNTTTSIKHVQPHDNFRGNGIDTFWYQFAASRPLTDDEQYRLEWQIQAALMPLQVFEPQTWELQNPINFFGEFIPTGTKFVRVNPDYYQPIINGARCPHYQVSFMIVRANETYFKRVQ
jgi:hypothetical protein